MNKILRNIGYTSISQFFYTFLAFIIIPIAARYLQPEGIGLFSLASTIGLVIYLAAESGSTILVTRETAQHKNITRPLFGLIQGLKLRLIAIAVLILIAYLLGTGKDAYSASTIVIFVSSSALLVFVQSYLAIFRGHEQMQYESAATVLEKMISFILGIIFLLFGGDVRIFVVSFLIAAIAKLLYVWWVLKKRFCRPQISWHRRREKILWLHSLPFGITAFLGVCYNYSSIFFLSEWQTIAEVGYFSVSQKFSLLTSMIPTILATVFLPQFSLAKGDRQKLTASYIIGISFLLLIAIPMVPWVFLLSREIILFIFGSAYQPAIVPLKILVFAAFAQIFNTFFVPLYAAVDRAYKVVYFQLVGLAVNILLNFILIRPYAASGAALVAVGTEWIILILLAAYAIKNIFVAVPVLRQLRPYLLMMGAITMVGVFFIWILKFYSVSFIVIGISLIIIYFAALHFLGYLKALLSHLSKT